MRETLYERTKHLIFNKPLEKYDFVLQSEDKKSIIIFSFIDVELERYKSINYLVDIKDDQFAGQVDIWIDQKELNRFVDRLLKAGKSEVENISLRAMSEEEMEVTFISQSMGRYEITYFIKRTKYSRHRLIETTLKGSFEYDIEFLILLKEKLKAINKLLS